MLEAIEHICGRLSERTATLFLGAGINAGIVNRDGVPFPLGQDLSNWIARDLLNDPELITTLDEAAAMGQYKWGKKEVNKYLFDKFSTFDPGKQHFDLVQLPWDIVYTTNYDLLVEKAAESPGITPAGRIRQVFSSQTDLSSFTENDILYYKLHGSVDFANTEAGRLIITKEDYRYYEAHRKQLFMRLKKDLLSRTMVFLGYSLQDDNFQAILQDCRDELGTHSFPLSFAVRPHFTESQETFWLNKYNIQLVKASAATFLDALKATWVSQNRSVTPYAERTSKVYLHFDEEARFQQVGDSYFQVRAEDCTGSSNAKRFFRGGEPNWADIKRKVAPTREVYWTLLDSLFAELAEPNRPRSAYLVTGAAGTGKTTLIRSLVYDIAHDFNFPVLVHIPGTPLSTNVLGALVDRQTPKRLIVVIHHAADYMRELEQFYEDIRLNALPVTLLLEERKNQWNVAKSAVRSRLNAAEFELGALSKEEIASILDSLVKTQFFRETNWNPAGVSVRPLQSACSQRVTGCTPRTNYGGRV